MESKEFAKRFNEKLNAAKGFSTERKEELNKLKEKIISEAQEGFLDGIPDELPVNKQWLVFSPWIRVLDTGVFYIDNVIFSTYNQVEIFMNEIRKELSDTLSRKVEVGSFRTVDGFDVRFTAYC